MYRKVIYKDWLKGKVNAVNQLSAESQFEWLIKNKTCFCKEHCNEYDKDYSVIMNPFHDKCILPLQVSGSLLPKGVLATPLEGGGGLVGTRIG